MAKLLPAIVIHGGAWAIPDKIADASQDGVKEAAKIGYKVLMEGGSAVDAVESAVACLEDNPVFDAGEDTFYLRNKKPNIRFLFTHVSFYIKTYHLISRTRIGSQ